jgi:hypothetical protein
MPSNNFPGTAQCSTYFNPLAFYVWGNLKSLVYSDSIENKEALYQCNFDAGKTI